MKLFLLLFYVLNFIFILYLYWNLSDLRTHSSLFNFFIITSVKDPLISSIFLFIIDNVLYLIVEVYESVLNSYNFYYFHQILIKVLSYRSIIDQ